MLLLSLLVVTCSMYTIEAASGIAIGDACTNSTYCNYEGTASVDHTKCDASTCQCTSLYYGETGDTTCIQATVGGSCAGKTDAAAFCATADADAVCTSDTCACNTGFEQYTSDVDGNEHCRKIEVGTSCDSSSGGDAFCQTRVAAFTCNVPTQTCECPSGETYFDDDCEPESFVAACDTCRASGGHCYDVEDDGTPEGCSCPPSKQSSGSNAAGTLTAGCDEGLAHIGDYCDADGTPVGCVGDHVTCVHAGGLDNRFTCECLPGYSAIPVGKEKKCYISIAKETDPNCKWCQQRGGVCYDIDDDDIRDGCMCPASKSTSDENDPSKSCDTDHVAVTCAASTMQICYTPHNNVKYGDVAAKLTAKEAYVYIQGHLGQDPCRFSAVSSDYCVTLNLATGETDACSTSVTYPSHRTINYNNWMVLQTSELGRSEKDATVHFYCQYDTLTHTFTSSGSKVIGFASVASEGQEVHPALDMDVEDEFGRDATIQGIRLGQPTRLIVEMTDDKSVYDSIRPEVCIASNRPELADPATSSILLLYDACPVDNGYLNVRNTFNQDPADSEISKTGLFPMFQFEDSDYVFFHCAVKVCRNDMDCSAPSCSIKKRSVLSPVETLERHVRELPNGDVRLESLLSGPVKLLRDDPMTGGKFVTDKKTIKDIFGIPRKYTIMIAIFAAVILVAIVLAVAVAVKRRRQSPPIKKRLDHGREKVTFKA